jgi:hypothetical protein
MVHHPVHNKVSHTAFIFAEMSDIFHKIDFYDWFGGVVYVLWLW